MKTNLKILLLIIVLALLLRLTHINDKAYGTDEKHSINNSKLIIEKGLNNIKDFGNPPGFYYFSGIILKLFDSILSLKLTMILMGLISIFITYLFVSKILNEKIALAASFLLAINPMHILLSQHIRVYILLMLVYIISTLLLYNFIKNKNKINLYLLPIFYTIAVYIHYFSAIFILSHIITFFYFYRKNKDLLKKYFIVLIIVAILCLPLIPYFLNQYNYMITQENLTTIEKLSLSKIYYIAYPVYKFSNMMDISSTLSKAPYLIIAAPLVFFIFLFGTFKLYKENKEKTLFIMLNIILPTIILSLLGFIAPVYSFRYLTYLLPLFIIPIANLIKYKKQGLILLTIISILWLIILFQYYSIVTLKYWPVHFAI